MRNVVVVNGRIETLEHQKIALDELLEWFKRKPEDFAEGAIRSLSHLINPDSSISKKFHAGLAQGCVFDG
jgi:hypothetical protein